MKSPQHKRKQIYVDRHVQGGIVLRLAGIWLATTVLAIVMSVMLGYFSNPVMGFEYYLYQSGRTCGPLLLAFASVLPIAALYLVRFTHRCVGPIIRLRRALKELATGECNAPLKFRDSDYWHDLAEDFNQVNTKLSAARNEINELEVRIEELTQDKTELESAPVAVG